MAFQPKPLTTAILLIITAPVFAGETKHHFDIPAQPLDSALQQLAAQAGMATFFPQQVAAGKQTSGVKGTYSTEDAAALLLAENGLAPVIADGTISVKPAKVKASDKAAVENSSEATTTMETVNVVDKAKRNVNDPRNPDYRRTNASTATKTDTPIMETPYSVTVVPQQVLKDKQVIRVEDAITSVAGVQSSWTNGGQSDVFMMRGFQNTTLYRDGFMMPSILGGGSTKRQVANLEQIEVLKGAGSILFGRNEPGGVINLVTKRPQAESYHSLQQQFGSYGFYRTSLDSTGALTDDKQLLYRLNLSYENAGSFRDFVKTDSFFIAPSLTWNISPQTQVNLDLEYQHFDDHSDSGIPPMGTRPAPVPINRQIGDPLNNRNVGDRTYIGMNWSHKFNDNWKIDHRFGAEFLDKKVDFVFFFGQPDAQGNLTNVDATWTTGNRGFNNGISSQQNYYTTLNLTGKFNTAMIEHTTLWGFDYFDIENKDQGACDFVNTFCQADFASAQFNIFNPTYLTSVNPISHQFSPGANFTQDWYGVYFQDQMKLPFNLYANFGIRYDNASTRNNTSGVHSTDDHVSPRGGLLWRPVNWLSLYGSYSENFGVSNNTWNAQGQQMLPSQTAEQWEVGAKTEFWDGKLSTSFAYFELTKKNMAVSHPTIPMLQIASGERQSKGYEFEVSGEVLPGWRAVAAYTNLAYAKINVGWNSGVGDDSGNRLYNTPRNYGSFWNTYEFQDNLLHGLKVGGGIIAATQSQGTDANNFQLPGYVTMNMMSSYAMKVGKSKVSLQLNANNLLNKTYYSGTNTGSMIGVGAPRNFMGSVKVEF